MAQNRIIKHDLPEKQNNCSLPSSAFSWNSNNDQNIAPASRIGEQQLLLINVINKKEPHPSYKTINNNNEMPNQLNTQNDAVYQSLSKQFAIPEATRTHVTYCKQSGITLIELLVTVAIVAILSAVALPSYFNYIARSARAAAASALTENAQYMERKFTEVNCYQCAAEVIGSITIPRTQAPDTGTATYNITLDDLNTDETSYRLVATRTGGMASDECGDLILDQLGQKNVINQPVGATITAAQCWGN